MSCFVILCYSGNLNVNGATRNDAREGHPKETQLLTVIMENGYYKFRLFLRTLCIRSAIISRLSQRVRDSFHASTCSVL